MGKQDVCIIWGGTKDITRSESNQGLEQLMEFIDKHRNTNVIFIEVPHHYDLKTDSCVNEEIKIFNRKLKSLSEQYAQNPPQRTSFWDSFKRTGSCDEGFEHLK
jgi:hypothetical protein